MKKIFTTLMVVLMAIFALATTRLWVYLSDGTRTPYDFTMVDSISLAEPGVLNLTPASKTLPNTGGRFTITVQANKPWTATVDDPTALTLSAASGYGNGTLTCVAVANGDEVPYSAVITFTLEDGTVADLPVTVEALVVEPARLTLSPTSKSVGASGERFTVTVTSNKAWSVTANQPWVTLSANSGSGNGSFSVLVAANETNTPDNATITVTTATGNVSQTVAITRQGQPQGGGTGTLQGHDYVDLDLPSGTLWATCNVGADSPEAYGDYFAWGETSPKSSYSWSSYQYGSDYNQLTKYCNNSSYGKNGFTDTKTVLDAEDDAATVNWGSGWRMPTNDEMQELYNNCTSTWTTQNGVNGRKFTASNGNSIFLPAAGLYDGSDLIYAASYGCYWSSSLNSFSPSGAYGLYFGSGSVSWYYYGYRCYGRSVRPVVNR